MLILHFGYVGGGSLTFRNKFNFLWKDSLRQKCGIFVAAWSATESPWLFTSSLAHFGHWKELFTIDFPHFPPLFK